MIPPDASTTEPAPLRYPDHTMLPPAVTGEVPFMPLPDHTQLPCEDGRLHNPEEHPQSELLTACLLPRLRQLHPDGRFFVGADVGIYWKVTDPPLRGCRAPDWFYVPNVPPLLNGRNRRSYVLWQEDIPPLIVIEYVSGDGVEERDATPQEGKFWVFEQAVGAAYYAIFDPRATPPTLELYRLDEGRYQPVTANAAGRFPVPRLGVELGVWQATFRNLPMAWLRVWDSATGEMIPHPEERAEAAEGLIDDYRREVDEASERAAAERRRADDAARRAEDAARRAEDEKRRAEKLAERLRALGVDPDAA